MVRKMVRMATATLAMTSMFAMTAFAADPLPWNTNGGETKVEGDAWSVDPVIEVELPGELAFGINPMSLDADEDGTADAQIVSSDYQVINYSNIPVLVTASTTLTAKETVDILADADYESNGDLKASATAGKKSIWLVQLNPTASANVNGDAPVLSVTAIAAGNKNADVKGKVLGSTAAETLFKLDAHGETSGKINAGCVSGFRFGGAVDPNASFSEEDEIKVTTTFTLNTLSANQAANDFNAETGYDTTVVTKK